MPTTLNGTPVIDRDAVQRQKVSNPLITTLRGLNGLKMLSDGTLGNVSPRDMVTGVVPTVAGTPTFATLLGCQAPVVSATAYTSMTIPTAGRLTARMPMSIVVVCNTGWVGSDGVRHDIVDTGVAGTQNRIRLNKSAANNLDFYIWDNTAGSTKNCSEPVTAADWPASTNLVIIATVTAAGVMGLYLNGVVATTLNNGAGLGYVAVVDTIVSIGATSPTLGGGNPVNAPILVAIYGRVLSAGEIAYLSRMTQWFPDMSVVGVY